MARRPAERVGGLMSMGKDAFYIVAAKNTDVAYRQRFLVIELHLPDVNLSSAPSM